MKAKEEIAAERSEWETEKGRVRDQLAAVERELAERERRAKTEHAADEAELERARAECDIRQERMDLLTQELSRREAEVRASQMRFLRWTLATAPSLFTLTSLDRGSMLPLPSLGPPRSWFLRALEPAVEGAAQTTPAMDYSH